jgi:hypothetical protein
MAAACLLATADQLNSGGDQLGIASGDAPVGQHQRVFQAYPNVGSRAGAS